VSFNDRRKLDGLVLAGGRTRPLPIAVIHNDEVKVRYIPGGQLRPVNPSKPINPRLRAFLKSAEGKAYDKYAGRVSARALSSNTPARGLPAHNGQHVNLRS
jgi:hypothetical protein